jgi:hypothetical protein
MSRYSEGYWLEDQKEDSNQDKVFALRPDLNVKEPTSLVVEPLSVKGNLLSREIQDSLSSEISALAHNERTNTDIYQVLKRVQRLGELYEVCSSGSKQAEAAKPLVKEASHEALTDFAHVDEELVKLICKHCFSDNDTFVTFFQGALEALKNLPALGLSAISLPRAFSELNSPAKGKAAEKLLIAMDPESKNLPLTTNVVLEDAVVHGSLPLALSAVQSLLRASRADVLTSTLQKYMSFTPPPREVTDEEKKLNAILNALREKEGGEKNKTQSTIQPVPTYLASWSRRTRRQQIIWPVQLSFWRKSNAM